MKFEKPKRFTLINDSVDKITRWGSCVFSSLYIFILFDLFPVFPIGQRHRLIWYCRRCSVRGCTNPIPVHDLPRLRISNVDRFNERNGFTLEKAKKQTALHTNADYADHIALLANTPSQAESLRYSLEKAAGGIGLHVNPNKTVYMCFNQNQRGEISTLKGGSLKLVNKFTYLGSSEKWHQYVTSKDMVNYRQAIGHIEVRPIW